MGHGNGQPLAGEQLRQFARDGYLVLPALVSDGEVGRARKQIAALTGEESSVAVGSGDAVGLPPERTDHPGVARLLHDTPVLGYAAALVGQPLQLWGLPQIATRMPEHEASKTRQPPHIDGVPVEGSGLDTDTRRLQGFTVLAGVLLTHQPADPPSGNLTVWPGSHLRVGRWLADHGPELTDPHDFLDRQLPAIAADGRESVRIGGQPGDVVFAHYLLIHAAGTNLASQPRLAVFFRLEAQGRNPSDGSLYSDPWKEWPTIRQAAVG